MKGLKTAKYFSLELIFPTLKLLAFVLTTRLIKNRISFDRGEILQKCFSLPFVGILLETPLSYLIGELFLSVPPLECTQQFQLTNSIETSEYLRWSESMVFCKKISNFGELSVLNHVQAANERLKFIPFFPRELLS